MPMLALASLITFQEIGPIESHDTHSIERSRLDRIIGAVLGTLIVYWVADIRPRVIAAKTRTAVHSRKTETDPDITVMS